MSEEKNQRATKRLRYRDLLPEPKRCKMADGSEGRDFWHMPAQEFDHCDYEKMSEAERKEYLKALGYRFLKDTIDRASRLPGYLPCAKPEGMKKALQHVHLANSGKQRQCVVCGSETEVRPSHLRYWSSLML